MSIIFTGSTKLGGWVYFLSIPSFSRMILLGSEDGSHISLREPEDINS